MEIANYHYRIAIVHYHLRTGGVRRVIDNTLLALKGSGVKAAVIAGEGAGSENSPELMKGIPLGIVNGLQYTNGSGANTGRKLAKDLRQTARRLLGDAPDLWHFHNHCLGKNFALPLAARVIAEENSPVLLQIHDFAEDGRPRLYNRMLTDIGGKDPAKLNNILYPVADHVHYALINKRDVKFLEKAGTPPGNTHYLPNPVTKGSEAPAPADSHAQTKSNLVVYPTRAIRRKNIGEVLLWATVADKNLRFGLTRGPKNPQQQKIYNRWRDFSKRLNLPVSFEMAEKPECSFDSLINKAHSIITTSITEGFGLCFLEPFLAKKSLSGRALPEITQDFKSKGIDLSNLYEKLLVPVKLIGKDKLRTQVENRLKTFYNSYKLQLTRDTIENVMGLFVRDDMVDFGRLDEPLQETIISHLKQCPQDLKTIDPKRLQVTPVETVEKNCRVIEDLFSLENYRDSLLKSYAAVAGSETTGTLGTLQNRKLLDFFMSPSRFSLLKT